MKSRTIAAASCTLCAHSTPGRRMRGIERVAGEDVHRNAVAVGVVDRHRRVLQTDRAVDHDGHRLAFGLEVAMGHRDRRLLVAAGEELRRPIAAVVDDATRGGRESSNPGLAATYSKSSVLITSTMKSPPGRSVVRTSTSSAGSFSRGGGGAGRRRRGSGLLGHRRSAASGQRSSASDSGGLQEAPAIHRRLLRHGRVPFDWRAVDYRSAGP